MIPDTQNLQEAKSVYPSKPVRPASVDPARYFAQSPKCWFPRGTAHIQSSESEKCYVADMKIHITLHCKYRTKIRD